MRALLMILGALFLLASCAKEVQLVESGSTKEPATYQGKSEVELRLSENDLAKYVDKENGVWEEARRQGLQKAFAKVLEKKMLVVPVDGTLSMDSFSLYSQSGAIVPADPETGDIVQNFMIGARMVCDLKVGGQVVTLEDTNYVAGMLDTAYGMLYDAVPESLPAFVALAEPADEVGFGFYRIIGLAEVKQVLDNYVQLPVDLGELRGRLCVIEVIASDREIEKNDLMFLLSVDVEALAPSGNGLAVDETLDTVVVQPTPVDSVREPKEQK